MSTPASGPRSLKEYLLDFKDLKLEREIGVGAAGAVWLGVHLPSKRKVAVKKFYGSEMTQQQKLLFYREVTSLVTVQHRFLLEFIGYTENPCCLVTKYIKNGSLFDILHDPEKKVKLTPLDMSVIAFGVSLGMQYIHSLNMIHRDLKPQNILIDDNKMPVICDFGSSRQMETAMTGLCGTANYMALEVIEGGNYNQSADVYSYGMVLWEMLTGEIPFEGRQTAQIICALLEKVNSGQQSCVDIPDGTPEPLGSLILKCCSFYPDERPSFEMIVQALQAGKVMFPGCKASRYFKVTATFAGSMKRRRSSSTSSQFQPFVPSKSGGNSLPTPKGNRNPIMKQMRNIQLAKSYLTSFTNGTEQQVRMSLEFFLAHSDDKEISSVDIWPKFLWLLVAPPATLVDKAIQLSIKLAQNSEIFQMLKNIPDLHTFLCPNTYDLFLYIVSFLPQKIDYAVIQKLFEHAQDEKAIILLCKLLQTLEPDSELATSIMDFFESNIFNMVNRTGGHLVLRRLTADGNITLPMIQAFAQSEVTKNIVATYECYFSLGPVNSLVFTLDQIFNHVVSEDAGVRACALEFLRRHARNAEGDPLRRMIEVLLQCVTRYYEENAVLLLCRIAQDPGNNCWEFQKRETAEVWLNIAPEKVPIMMRFFVCVFSQERMLPFVTSLPATADFLAAAMNYGDNQCFLSACFMLKKISFDDSYARRLDELGAINTMIQKLNEVTKPKSHVIIGKVIRIIGRIYYSPQFMELVPMIMESLTSRTSTMKEMIKTASVVSHYKEIATALLDENIIGVMTKCNIPSDVASFARTIYKNVKASSFDMM